MEIISITNDKGGVGKTTTAVNIAVGLGKYPHNKRVLVIDLDGQTDASRLLGWKRDNEKAGYPTIYTSLSKEEGLTCYESSYNNVWICPASPNLNDVEGHLRSRDVAVLALRECMEQPVKLSDGTTIPADEAFDYIIIDCPPAMNLLTKNALACADSMLIPLQLEALAVESLGGVLEQFVKMRKTVNPKLTIKGIVRCMAQKQLKLSKGLSAELSKNVAQYLCKTSIPRSTIVPTSQVEHNVTVDSDPYCDPSLAYKSLIEELFIYNI